MRNVVIIGSGPAGLTAAIYTARANLAPLLIEGVHAGGQLALTTEVENYPGFHHAIMGPELIKEMRAQAGRFGTEFVQGDVSAVDLKRTPFTLTIGGERSIETRTLIIASGASANMLGLKSERRLLGHGVSTCATCDGFFFRGKEIVVVGGGDTAMEEALFLTRFASRVHLIHRRREFRATKIMLDRARANGKIHFITPAVVEDISDVGKNSVEAVLLRDLETAQKSELLVEGVFVAIGHEPNTKVFRSILDTDENGYLSTRNGSQTNIQGVFAAGDVQDHHYRQAVTAAGSGCMAAMDAEKFLEATGH